MKRHLLLGIMIGFAAVCLAPASDTLKLRAGDYLQWGGGPTKNNVSAETDLPTAWNVGHYDYRLREWDDSAAENLRWHVQLGSECYNAPVVSRDKVFIGTNNAAARIERYPDEIDLGVMLAFDRSTGDFLWQYSSTKLDDGQVDWPEQGICSTPYVEGERMWFVSNRNEVVCLDTEGFRDGENDGPVLDEEYRGQDEADVVWRYDMLGQLRATPHNMACSSPTVLGDLLFVGTSNGVDARGRQVAQPEAPSFLCLEKSTGRLVWSDNSPGRNILDGQWGSPAVGELGGVPQVIFPGGDGWLYSFRAERTEDARAELLWKFDCNPKDAVWEANGYGDRNYLVATPVIADGFVYIATGQDPELGEGQGDLWCIDPTGRGDVSAERVVDADGRPVAPEQLAAVDRDAGQRVIANPDSAAVWHYRGQDIDGDGELDFEETFHRTIGMVAVDQGLLVVGDHAGLVHCLDAKTGRRLWCYDTKYTIWGSPLLADGKIYLGDADGDVSVFRLSDERELLAENLLYDSLYSAPVAAGGRLYFATRGRLFCVGE